LTFKLEDQTKHRKRKTRLEFILIKAFQWCTPSTAGWTQNYRVVNRNYEYCSNSTISLDARRCFSSVFETSY